MVEQIQYILARHPDRAADREDESYRLDVIGPQQLRPAERDPLADDWREQYSEEELTPRTPEGGLSFAESPQPEPVQGVLREESPVSP